MVKKDSDIYAEMQTYYQAMMDYGPMLKADPVKHVLYAKAMSLVAQAKESWL